MTSKFEQKGSIFLRSKHMDYARTTLVPEKGLDWHAAREAEPKDHEVYDAMQYDAKSRNLRQSTYNRVGDDTNGELPISTCHDHMNQITLKGDYEEKPSKLVMINASTFGETDKPRNISAPVQGFGSVLPHHPATHNKRYLDTTYGTEYIYGHPYGTSISGEAEEKDNPAYRKCRSQFTDVADYHRVGKNTWQEESGQYANSQFKETTFKKTNPIPERF